MKRNALLRHVRAHGCHLKREGRRHSLSINPVNGRVEAVPRHPEVDNQLARNICRSLDVPVVGG
ncbi:MAG: addiction module toxin, HicA family [Planctomycetes bacterium]|nr:addiction module toxin, HicA family [Planctomycetota bacterium]